MPIFSTSHHSSFLSRDCLLQGSHSVQRTLKGRELCLASLGWNSYTNYSELLCVEDISATYLHSYLAAYFYISIGS